MCERFFGLFTKIKYTCMAIEWKEDYALGISVIDEQHKEFISILRALSMLLSSNYNELEFQKLVEKLEAYAHFHLDFEEKYFEEFDYKDKVEHTAEHTVYRERIQEFKNTYSKENPLLSIELLAFLEDWLEHHIKISDKKYVECFLSNGLS